MTILTVESSFNRRNPKCVYCKYYKPQSEEYWLSGKCTNENTRAAKDRDYDSKACSHFRKDRTI